LTYVARAYGFFFRQHSVSVLHHTEIKHPHEEGTPAMTEVVPRSRKTAGLPDFNFNV